MQTRLSKLLHLFMAPIILLAGIGLRIYLYEDPNLSIASNDTLSFVESSQSPLFSSEMLTGRRLLATNLLYKAFEPKDGYQILANGSIETTRKIFQTGFNQVAITQLFFSIIGWGLLAFFFTQNIKNSLLKMLSAVVIVLFAFTPQMADWDSILTSESLNFSLFALQLAILVHLVFAIRKDPNQNMAIWAGLWAISYFLWTFVRPTNLFISPFTVALIASLLFFPQYRNKKYLYVAILFVAGVFILGIATTGKSVRSLNYDVYKDDLLSSPARVTILMEMGMPSPDSLEYTAWFEESSTKTLIRFMLAHPGYPTTKILKDFPEAFKEINQTYFNVPEQKQIRTYLTAIGDAVHPQNTTPFLMSLILLLGLIYLAINSENNSRPWVWLGIWLFLIAGVTLIISILGDTWGLNRHALFSTMIYRLCMWLFAIIVMDLAMEQASEDSKPLPQP